MARTLSSLDDVDGDNDVKPGQKKVDDDEGVHDTAPREFAAAVRFCRAVTALRTVLDGHVFVISR